MSLFLHRSGILKPPAAGGGGGAGTINGFTSGQLVSGSGGTLNIPVTISATGTHLLVGISCQVNSVSTITGVAVNGSSCTQLLNGKYSAFDANYFGVVSFTTTGSQNVSVTISPGTGFRYVAHVWSISDFDTSTPVATDQWDPAEVGVQGISTQAGGAVFLSASDQSGPTASATGLSNDATRTNWDSTWDAVAYSTDPATSTTGTLSITLTGGARFFMGAVSLAPA